MKTFLIEQSFTEGMWSGSPAFVIGGGRSLIGFPFHKLKEAHVVAVNRAHECGVADLVLTGDRRWLTRYAPNEELDSSLPVIYAHRDKISLGPLPFDVHTVQCCAEGEWGRTLKEGVSPGGSGIRAVNLAAILGASPIYLLGFDMGGVGHEQVWWHAGYERRRDGWYEEFCAYWELVADKIPQTLYNLSPQSNLQCVAKLDWRVVLMELEGSK